MFIVVIQLNSIIYPEKFVEGAKTKVLHFTLVSSENSSQSELSSNPQGRTIIKTFY
jgi:hypothetical protein